MAGGDNFRRTTFDDAAEASIAGAEAPFRGTFRPEESLTQFEEELAKGTWKLSVEDAAFQDGGSLNRWSLSIETCSHVFENTTAVAIDPGPASMVTSTIDTGILGGLVVERLTVMVDIDHTFDNDLTISLIGPDDTAVVLSRRRGGQRDDFDHTTFDDASTQEISVGAAPFRGIFKPDEPLSAFKDKLVSGTWTLKIEDHAAQDGGSLNRWQLIIESCTAAPRTDTNFNIELDFRGGLNANLRSVFQLAAARWAEVIIGDLAEAEVDGRVIDDVLIRAEGKAIDGRLGVLGQAGPRIIRTADSLPIVGEMTFDTADLADMEQDGSLISVILHEMGHVLGIGTLWSQNNLLSGGGTQNPEFTGANAVAEYSTLTNAAEARVPVANTGGPGTAEGHWRETTFDHELMTGFVEQQGEMPLSRMTIASLQDLGYVVSFANADNYALPSPAARAARSLVVRRSCCVDFPEILVLDDGGKRTSVEPCRLGPVPEREMGAS